MYLPISASLYGNFFCSSHASSVLRVLLFIHSPMLHWGKTIMPESLLVCDGSSGPPPLSSTFNFSRNSLQLTPPTRSALRPLRLSYCVHSNQHHLPICTCSILRESSSPQLAIANKPHTAISQLRPAVVPGFIAGDTFTDSSPLDPTNVPNSCFFP